MPSVQFAEHLRLTALMLVCDTSQCGACVIHKDGQSTRAVTILATQCEGADVTTIEGLADGEPLPFDARSVSAKTTDCNAASARPVW